MSFFVGKHIADLADMAGATRCDTRKWITNNGYMLRDGYVTRPTPVPVNEAKFFAQRVNAPPHVPCWRCGVRMGCGHR